VRIAVVGTGLMGASVALAAQARGDEVVGFDPDPDALAAAVARGAVAAAASHEEAVAGAELVVVAAPIAQLPSAVVAALAAASEATVIDVGSTKASVVDAAAGSPRFVGSHPICGSETRGADNATASLFEGATWFLTPVTQTDPDRYRTVHGFVTDVGATPVAIDPEAHDRLVALTSHVPHVLANVVANQTVAHAGGSLRDMTRIAGANPRIWVDIFLDNADRVRAELAEHRRRIEQVEQALERGDAGFLARWIGEASSSRRRMLEREYPDPGELQRLRVHVPDRPGVLAGITQALGAERINIEDFELHHVSPERGGTLTLLVTGEGEAQRAALLLEGQGYSVVVSAVIDEG
jgi:prephenate dehydrogenase